MILLENTDYSMAYELYLINEKYEEDINMLKTYGFLSEAVSLQEAAGDKIKEFVDRIITAIANAWGKFTEAIKNLIQSDEKFLNDNKETILNQKLNNTKINNFYKYDLSKIKNAKIPEYDPNIEQYSENKNQFIEHYFPDFKLDEEDGNFTDKVKSILRGGEAISIQTTDSALNMQTIYDYCKNYKQVQDAISSDIEKIKSSNKKAYVKIQSIKAFSPKEKPKIEKESFDFSKTLEYYFTEAEDDDKKTTGSGPDIQDDPEEDSSSTSNDNNSNNKDESSNATKAANAIKLYYNICSQYLGARMTIANEAYKAYMKIMKWHVSKHGNKQSEAEGTKNADEKNKEFDNAEKK